MGPLVRVASKLSASRVLATDGFAVGVIGLGHSLGLPIVAEGIEDLEAANPLQLMGCELGQGWLYGRPMLAEDVAALLRHAESDPAPAVDSF
jgi:EAL domain-containing protein (putative c-di-GMP-specific phosphodiesterase class I)